MAVLQAKEKIPSILLVEDMLMVQIVTTQLLASLHCAVDVASSGEEALKFFESNDYDIVLMDIGLPGMDGFEATRCLRETEKGKRVPILAVTAHAVDEIKDQGHAFGMTELISKPLVRDKIDKLLNDYFYKKRGQDET